MPKNPGPLIPVLDSLLNRDRHAMIVYQRKQSFRHEASVLRCHIAFGFSNLFASPKKNQDEILPMHILIATFGKHWRHEVQTL
jgi:hypothetical protein